MTQLKTKPFPIPINYFGIVLGLLALGLAWRYATSFFSFSAIISESLMGVGSFVWLIFILAYIWKWIAYREQAKAELNHLILGCFVSLIPITTCLIGLGILPYSPIFAKLLFILGIIGQLGFSAFHTAGMWRGTFNQESATPAMYLPTVATNFTSAVVMGTLGYQDMGMIFFGAGFFSWLILEPSVLQRLRTVSPLAENLRPIIGIQLAPAFVGASAYLSVNGGEIDLLVKMLIGYGLLQLLFLIRLLPWIFANGFTPSVWGFSFGLASMAKVGIVLAEQNQAPIFYMLGLTMFSFATLCIALMFIGTLYLLVKGRFFVK
ncbi:Tellurite resistance protein tehA [Phocoenobacter uteri]|uniref:Tellurite resistance protein tehA n=1 Tax=Phocoenobacter uteri TaxID=146806 RepID=A0A379CCN6_9PAST|nr:dicarboxylate transporter/tellurite-resistance protein TehA [Phocoenobacter uteri]MDG6881389.1 potassium-tellurite ethidium and proflavin transporter [Phocoenobacter uteri]SUB59417.1 Tellurite resistance protein tehA [Phocoenobacter uteri]